MNGVGQRVHHLPDDFASVAQTGRENGWSLKRIFTRFHAGEILCWASRREENSTQFLFAHELQPNHSDSERIFIAPTTYDDDDVTWAPFWRCGFEKLERLHTQEELKQLIRGFCMLSNNNYSRQFSRDKNKVKKISTQWTATTTSEESEDDI